MKSEMYENDVKPWYGEYKLSGRNWMFMDEFKKYCRADVEVLSKAVLAFRTIFKDGSDVGPFRYTTLGPLFINSFRSKYMPEKMRVSNANNKADSRVCRECFLHVDQDINGGEYEYEIWIDNKYIDTPYYKHVFSILQT